MADIYEKIAFINDVYDAYKKGSISRLKLLAINWKQYADETISYAQKAEGYATNASNSATLAQQNASNAALSAQTAENKAEVATAAAASAQSAVQSDWTEADTTARSYIKNKPTIPTVDQTYDSTSVNAQSGVAIAGALTSYQLIAQSMTSLSASGSITLSDNSVNKITATGTVTFTLPTITDVTVLHQIFIELNMSTAQTINLGTTYYFNSAAPDLSTAGTYNLYYEYDNTASHWVVGCISKGAAS